MRAFNDVAVSIALGNGALGRGGSDGAMHWLQAFMTVTAPLSGVDRSVRFLKTPAGDIFCSVHMAAAGTHSTLVLCPPLLADHPFSYRREVLMANRLANEGVTVWRFHYTGTGHSGGAPTSHAFETMVADARLVVDVARRSSAAPVTVGGTRCGAMIAAMAAPDCDLVCWEPVSDGSAYLREGFRARMIADGGQLQRTPPSAAELTDELRRKGWIDLVGYSLHSRLYDSIVGLKLVDLVGPRAGRVLLVGAALPDTLAGQLSAAGLDVTSARVGVDEAWWFHRTQQSNPEVVAGDLAAIIRPWLARSPEPATVSLPAAVEATECEFIHTGEISVFALLTPPSAKARGEAALVLWGGGGVPTFGRNQVATKLAVRLAERGYHVLRIDYPGRGESPGDEPSDPIVERDKQAVFAATVAAYQWLSARGLDRVLTIGSCQGAVAAINAASEGRTTLTGLALLAPPVAERIEDAGARASEMHPRMGESFRSVVGAGIPLLVVYGSHDEGFLSFQAALDGALGALFRSAGDRVTVSLSDERIHGYMTVPGQEAAIELVMGWVETLVE